MERLKQVKKKLAGISFTPQTEPSHSLIDKVCQQAEDNVVSYIDLTKCTSRHDESLQNRTDTSLALDSSGGLRVAKKLKTEDIPINGAASGRLSSSHHGTGIEYGQGRVVTCLKRDPKQFGINAAKSEAFRHCFREVLQPPRSAFPFASPASHES